MINQNKFVSDIIFDGTWRFSIDKLYYKIQIGTFLEIELSMQYLDSQLM